MPAVPAYTAPLERSATGEELPELLKKICSPVAEGLDRVRESLEGLESPSPFLGELLDHVLEPTGKRLRPALTLLASRFHPNDGRKAEIMASAVELLHIATLIHDDTVDNSDIRRGKATVSSLWGRNTAVLLGDYVFAASATFVCDTGSFRVIRRFAETSMDLSAGELHEMVVVYRLAQTREDYIKRIYNKTASLFSTAAEAGAVLSGAPEGIIRAFKRYGGKVGIAFQIVDDILDFDATREEVGKPVGNDLARGILTLPAIIAVERFGRDGPIASFFGRPADADMLREAVAMIQDSSVIEESYEVASRYCSDAAESLTHLDASPARDSLADLVSYVLRRRG